MGDRQQLTASSLRAIWWGYAHFAAYSLVNSALLLRTLVYSPDRAWSTWPLLLWSVVLIAHIVLILALANREDGDRERHPRVRVSGFRAEDRRPASEG